MRNILQKGNWEGFKNHPETKQTVINALELAAEQMSQTEIKKLEAHTIGYDYLLPTDLIHSIINWLSWSDKYQMQLVCKTFNGLIQKEKDNLFDDESTMWNWLGFSGMQRSSTAELAVYLSGRYTWDDIFTGHDWAKLHHVDSASRQQQALTTFTLKGIDALIKECLKKHNIEYQIKGMVCDHSGVTFINELLECQTLGITMGKSFDETQDDMYYSPEAVCIIGPRGYSCGPVFSVMSQYQGFGWTPLPALVHLIFAIKNPFYIPVTPQSTHTSTPKSVSLPGSIQGVRINETYPESTEEFLEFFICEEKYDEGDWPH